MECLGAGAPESHPADSCRLKGNDADDNDKPGMVMPRGRVDLEDHKFIQVCTYSQDVYEFIEQ